MADERCMPGHHLGEDNEGRCSFCGESIEHPGPWLIALAVIAVVLAAVLAIRLLLSRWPVV
jgi:hypothetical protein